MTKNIYDQFLKFYDGRNGERLAYRLFEPAEAKGILVFLHGSSLNSLLYSPLGVRMANKYGIRTYLPDMRGHGQSAGKRGTIDYVGQLEDDLQYLVSKIKNEFPDLPIFLGAHSAGTSVVIHYLCLENIIKPDGYIFVAPLKVQDENIERLNKDGEAEFLCTLNLRLFRYIDFFNSLGIKLFNHIKCLTFTIPKKNRGMNNFVFVSSYSYNLVKNIDSIHYYYNFKLIDKPVIIIAARNDTVVPLDDLQDFCDQYLKSELDKTFIAIDNKEHFDVIFEVFKHAGPWITDKINELNKQIDCTCL